MESVNDNHHSVLIRNRVQKFSMLSIDEAKSKIEDSNIQQRHCNASAGAFEYTRTSRYRWNVLDLLNLFGKKALTGYMLCNIDMSLVEKLRKKLKVEDHVTVTAFLLKAIAIAQKSHPASRSSYYRCSRLLTSEQIVAGFTVERELADQPIVFFGEIEDADEKSILELAGLLREFAYSDIVNVTKLRQQKQFAEMPCLLRQLVFELAAWFPSLRQRCMRATFGLSSLGALGVTEVFGPSVCTSVFGVGSVLDRAIVDEGEIVVRPILTMSLSFDLRVMDGAQASRFLNEVKELLEGGLNELN